MKPEVEIKVGNVVDPFWEPVAYSFAVAPVYVENNDDRRRVAEEYPRIDDEQLDKLVETVRRELGDVAEVSCKTNEIRINLPNVNDFSITITRESSDDIDNLTEFNTYELDEMTKDEAIDYIEDLSELEESLNFEYVSIFISTGRGGREYILDCNKFINEIETFKATLAKTPEVFNSALKAASIELQKKTEKQREIDNRIKAKKEEEARLLAEFAAKVEPYLIDAGWFGKYRVSMNFNNYVLSLQLTSYDECRYESITQTDVISKIGELINFANAFRSLKIAGGVPVLHGDQVKTADWKVIKKQ